MTNAKPFIIWTLQRTGGTNLAKHLFMRSRLLEKSRNAADNLNGQVWLDKIKDQWDLHEPFNTGKLGRVFSSITDGWLADADRDTLGREINAICELKLPIKHCVEVVPQEITEELIKASRRVGYKHVFLYRINQYDRLLSMYFAQSSGVWGPHCARDGESLSQALSTPLPVDDLISHEKRSISNINMAWNLLKDEHPVALSYEDIYQNNSRDNAFRLLKHLLGYLGLSKNISNDRKFISSLLQSGDQDTRKEYGGFTGQEILESSLKQLDGFNPHSNAMQLEIIPVWKKHTIVKHASLDSYPVMVEPDGKYNIGGVVVMNDCSQKARLYISDEQSSRPITWGIKSPLMHKRFPKSANSGHSRFKMLNLNLTKATVYNIWLDNGDGERITILSMKTEPYSS